MRQKDKDNKPDIEQAYLVSLQADIRMYHDLCSNAETKLAGLQCFTDANLEFQQKIIERSGLGDSTGLSDG